MENTSFPARRTRGNAEGGDVPLPDSQVTLLPPGSVFPRQLVSVGPAELKCKQQEDGSLEPLFAKVNQSGKECKEEFMLVDGVLHRRWTGGVTEEDGGVGDVVQVIVPSEYREVLMQLAHEGPLVGHLGVRKTVYRLRRIFWWSDMARLVASYIRRYHTCEIAQPSYSSGPLKAHSRRGTFVHTGDD